MSVVKSLALGTSILGSLVAPTLAGSIRSSHHVPERAHRAVLPTQAPTSLVMAPVAVPVALPVAPISNAAMPALNASQENLATLGTAPPNQVLSNYNPSGAAFGGGLSLGTTAATGLNATIPTATYTAPAATSLAGSSFAPAAPAATAAGHSVDAYINLGNGPYSEAQSLTTGAAQSWTLSPAAQAVFHGTPTAAQQADFTYEVIKTIQTTYNQSGLAISLTTDPTANYAHTMSVVSGASYTGNSSAIGITDVGNDGFSFIDKFGQAKTPTELADAVGHNLAHELMHAFGVASHPDQTGTYLDAASASWSTLTNPSTTFSPQAVALLSQENFLNGPGKDFTQGANGMTGLELLTEHHPVTCNCPYCQALRKLKAADGLAPPAAAAVPEPTTVALWGAIVAAAAVARRRASRGARA